MGSRFIFNMDYPVILIKFDRFLKPTHKIVIVIILAILQIGPSKFQKFDEYVYCARPLCIRPSVFPYTQDYIQCFFHGRLLCDLSSHSILVAIKPLFLSKPKQKQQSPYAQFSCHRYPHPHKSIR